MNWAIVIIVSFLYLVLLFILAFWAEKKAESRSLINSPYVYALSLAVYCTAWTFYGSVGRAATSGVDFLLIYVGPTIAAPLWWFILRKIIRIAKVQNISNIADLIATRYGKSISLGVLVTLFSVLGVVPYIALQLKAISESFAIILDEHTTQPIQSASLMAYAFYIVIVLGIFTVLFGTRQLDLNRKNEGIVFAIAFESIFKLIAFLVAGIFVTFFMFDGFSDIFRRANEQEILSHLLKIDTSHLHKPLEWFLVSASSMFAVMFLPRQFQMLVAENKDEKHLQKAIWLFPLYLWLINIFVIPIALAGKLSLNTSIDADAYILALPLAQKNFVIALLVYLGGLAAATSMVIVSTMALSLMLTNNLFIPIALRAKLTNYLKDDSWAKWVLYIRRLSIILVLALAYLYLSFITNVSLVSIGLVSFVAVSQFAPSIIGGLYWKEATGRGATLGILLGFIVWGFTLVLPVLVSNGIFSKQILTHGFLGISWLKPHQLFGLDGIEPIAHALFWSLSFNILAYIGFSIFSVQSSQERNQAEFFVDVLKHGDAYENRLVWRGTAHQKDLENLLIRFLDMPRVEKLMEGFEKRSIKNTLNPQEKKAALVRFAERILANAIGSTSARMLVASVVQEEELSKDEVLKIIQESQELKKLNLELKKADNQKNEFISTVTHELRTPLTSIRSLSEILSDNPDLEEEEKQHFLHTVISETERMERLINQVLDLEKFESGKQKLILNKQELNTIILEALEIYRIVIQEKGFYLEVKLFQQEIWVKADRDRLLQVILNFLSNALKFAEKNIWVESFVESGQAHFCVCDDGKGVPPNLEEAIFEKFFQAENQNIRKPKGSGLGLAISKKIIQYHQGLIGVKRSNHTTKFFFTLPTNL
ncbi:MAG: sensor histidine kinase [Thermonemataceae bacterium]|nr:sensor histidine kinase [Thermonemataceae bacterium]